MWAGKEGQECAAVTIAVLAIIRILVVLFLPSKHRPITANEG